ncbi:MAG: metal ABC transporter permease [Myxococcota bacterium]
MLTYPPILRGLLALAVAGLSFPLTGVLVLRMNLITLRFALMHAALLGGAAGIALGVHPTPATLVVSAILVGLMGRIARKSGAGLGPVTTMIMAVSVAAAAAITYRFDVPARDTLALLWGNIYALRPIDLWTTVLFAVALISAAWTLRRQLSAMMLETTEIGDGFRAFHDDTGHPVLGDFKAAGKTGADRDTKSSSETTWFIGFAPVERPEVAIATTSRNRRGASGTAKALAADVLRAYFAPRMQPSDAEQDKS